MVLVPEIADYEVRRELLRARKHKSIERLDFLKEQLVYVPLTTATMQRAAELWAEARNQGRPTTSGASLDADVILAAQAIGLQNSTDETIVATDNVDHLARFVEAKRWMDLV